MPIRVFIDQGHNPSGVNAGGRGLWPAGTGHHLCRGDGPGPAFKRRPPVHCPGLPHHPTESLGAAMPPACSAGSTWPIPGRQTTLSASTATPTPTGHQRHRGLCLPAEHPGLLAGPACAGGIVEEVGTRDNGVRLSPPFMCCAAPPCPPFWWSWPTSPTATTPKAAG